MDNDFATLSPLERAVHQATHLHYVIDESYKQFTVWTAANAQLKAEDRSPLQLCIDPDQLRGAKKEYRRAMCENESILIDANSSLLVPSIAKHDTTQVYYTGGRCPVHNEYLVTREFEVGSPELPWDTFTKTVTDKDTRLSELLKPECYLCDSKRPPQLDTMLSYLRVYPRDLYTFFRTADQSRRELQKLNVERQRMLDSERDTRIIAIIDQETAEAQSVLDSAQEALQRRIKRHHMPGVYSQWRRKGIGRLSDKIIEGFAVIYEYISAYPDAFPTNLNRQPETDLIITPLQQDAAYRQLAGFFQASNQILDLNAMRLTCQTREDAFTSIRAVRDELEHRFGQESLDDARMKTMQRSFGKGMTLVEPHILCIDKPGHFGFKLYATYGKDENKLRVEIQMTSYADDLINEKDHRYYEERRLARLALLERKGLPLQELRNAIGCLFAGDSN